MFQKFPRCARFGLVVLLTVFAATAACGTSNKRYKPLAETSIGPAGAVVRFAGGALAVPPNAVPGPTTLRVRPADGLQPPKGSPIRPVGTPVSIDLSGRQPSRPLQLSLNIPGNPAAGAPPGEFFLASSTSPTSRPQVLATQYDSVNHRLNADVGHVTLFTVGVLDAHEMLKQISENLRQTFLGWRTPRPTSCNQSIVLSDMSAVRFSQTSTALGGDDPDAWGCLGVERPEANNAQPGQDKVKIGITNNRPTAFSFVKPANANIQNTELWGPTSRMERLYRQVFQELPRSVGRNVQDRGFLAPTAKVQLTIPASSLPQEMQIDLDADDQAFAVVGAEVSIMGLASSLFAGTSVPGAVDAALQRNDNVECINTQVNTIEDQPLSDQEKTVKLYNATIDCVLPIVAPIVATAIKAAQAVSVLTYATLDNLTRKLIGANTVSVIIDKVPPPAGQNLPPAVARPGGTWLNPTSDGTVPPPAEVHFSARAYPSRPGDPDVARVDFTWSQRGSNRWQTACSAERSPNGDVYECLWSLKDVPPGEVEVGFDVYDAAGNKSLSPNGTHTLVYQPNPTTTPPRQEAGVGLDISSGPPGTVVTASGGGYHPSQPITVSQSGPGGTREVATATADAAGRFSVTLRVGDDTPPGRLTLYFRQAPDISVTDTFYVTACPGCRIGESPSQPSPNATMSPSSGTVPSTGTAPPFFTLGPSPGAASGGATAPPPSGDLPTPTPSPTTTGPTGPSTSQTPQGQAQPKPQRQNSNSR